MFIYGYKFPSNNAAIEHICNDKAALSDILESNQIPRIVVLENRVIQAYERIPFQVVGNGTDTIEKLLMHRAEDFQAAGRDKTINITDERILKNIINRYKQAFALS